MIDRAQRAGPAGRVGADRHCRLDFDHLPVGVVVLQDGAAVHANPCWTQLTGQQAPAWLGEGWLDVLDTRQRTAARRAVLGLGDDVLEADWTVRHPSAGGRVLRITAAGHRDASATSRVVLVAQDVTDDRANTARLAHLANHDPLTGLRNRRQFLEFVDRAIAGRERDDGAAAVIFIDVDQLKETNDRDGHLAGDRLLVGVAARIASSVRPGDVVARWGGDEFVVLCDDLRDADEAAVIAERIRHACRRERNGGRRCSVSTGVALVEEGSNAEDVMRAADRDMYRSKHERKRRGPDGAMPPPSRRRAHGVA